MDTTKKNEEKKEVKTGEGHEFNKDKNVEKDLKAKKDLEEKRNEFRKYLEQTGAINHLTAVLLKLFQCSPRPTDPVKFIRNNLGDYTIEDDEKYQAVKKELDALKQEKENFKKELSVAKSLVKSTPSDMVVSLKAGYEKIQKDEKNVSILKKILTEEIFEDLLEKKTEFKGTLLDCIQAGFDYPEAKVGIFACDPQAFKVFGKLFGPLLTELHDNYEKIELHPTTDWGNSQDLTDLDAAGNFVKATRISCLRSLDQSPFNPIDNQNNMESNAGKISEALKKMSGDVKGKYYDYEDFEKNQQDLKKDLKAGNLIFEQNNENLKAAKNYRFWPIARGIFVSDSKKFVVWVNEEEHIQVISQEEGGNLGSVYDRLAKAMQQIQSSGNLSFAKDEKLGYLNSNPINIGNTLKASVLLKLTKLGLPENEEKLQAILKSHHIKITGIVQKRKKVKIDDEKKENRNSKDSNDSAEVEADSDKIGKTLITFTSDHRLGVTEIDAMKEFHKGIQEVISLEKCLL